MEENNVLNDVGVEDDEDSVPDDEDEDDDDQESEEEEEDVNIARRNDGVLEGNVAEPLEPDKARRLASDADIVRTLFATVDTANMIFLILMSLLLVASLISCLTTVMQRLYF